MSQENNLPIFVLKVLIYAGLNHLMFFWLFSVLFGFALFVLRRLIVLCVCNLKGFVRNIMQLCEIFLLIIIMKIILSS